jgi:hypothetical protein
MKEGLKQLILANAIGFIIWINGLSVLLLHAKELGNTMFYILIAIYIICTLIVSSEIAEKIEISKCGNSIIYK